MAQAMRLQDLLKHCAQYVPHYREILRGLDVSAITPHNLSEYIPVIKKEDLLRNPERFISEKWGKKNLSRSSTTGSSGTPLEIFSTSEARRLNYRYYDSVLRQLGSCYRDRSTTLAGRVLYRKDCECPARYDRFNRTQYLSVYNISSRTIRSYISALNSWKPIFIDSHPSALFEIQYLAEKEDLALTFSPRFILTSSETLTDDIKRSAEKFFSAPIIDHYGCAEMAISAFSRGGSYYVDPAFSVVELKPEGGDIYSLITTGLLNYGMPLLRYDIGDSVRSVGGVGSYTFEAIEGRSDDIIVTPEGRMVGRMSPAFKGIRNLALTQVIQERVDLLSINVVLNKIDPKDFQEDLLIENVKKRTSEKMNVEVYYKNEIKKGKNGKFKTVISKVKKCDEG